VEQEQEAQAQVVQLQVVQAVQAQAVLEALAVQVEQEEVLIHYK
jgi:hypothetical protein